MIDLPYSLIIEATEEPDFFGFYSTDLEGFSGIGLGTHRPALGRDLAKYSQRTLPILLYRHRNSRQPESQQLRFRPNRSHVAAHLAAWRVHADRLAQ